MNFYSTNNKNNRVDIESAVRHGLAIDKGLFMPSEIQALPISFIDQLAQKTIPEIAFTILRPYFNAVITDIELEGLCQDAFSFEVPLEKVEDNIYSLELYHGPTLAFKDFGARFMARMLEHLNKTSDKKNTILVATSGDTGSAVASGFYKVKNTEVVILYPKGKVSDLQEKQMTTLGANIHALAITGTFDDCQRLVKQAFLDEDIASIFGLTSANSINLARLLPQMIYYFYAYGQLAHLKKPVIFSVPSGNYGNLTAGLIAQKMGLPIHHFIAASNANKIVPEYLRSGIYEPKPSIETISNAMDVGDPSNFVRMQQLFNHSIAEFREHISGYSYSDDDTRTTIKSLYENQGYIADPHGAIGYQALKDYLQEKDPIGVFLETAHPIKFRQEVELAIRKELPVPEQLQEALNKEVKSDNIGVGYDSFKMELIELMSH
jgi:threonine synthase